MFCSSNVASRLLQSCRLFLASVEYIPYFCSMNKIREIVFSDEFEEFYAELDGRTRDKYNYALNVLRTQYVVSNKFVKSLENTAFYELRVSVSANEYRTILFAIDHDSFIQCKRVLLLNSFLKKGTKQYKGEIKVAENILARYTED